MASLGGEEQILSNSQPAESIQRGGESREGSVERRVAKDRDEKLKLARERQNEERQRKIEELRAQAEAAQRYREQKEEERRRRIEEIRHRDSEKRNLVEERKKAIMEAEKERREYILRKNQERESRFEVKKRERNSIGFAFGSSTPRLLEPSDFGMVSPSTFWGQRRSTSITNVAGASLSRRSSERELNDSGSKKRATSASGTDRHDDSRRKTSSMYEVFNWGYRNDEPPKRFSLSIVGSEINIDEPAARNRRGIHATTTTTTVVDTNTNANANTSTTTTNVTNNNNNNNNYNNNNAMRNTATAMSATISNNNIHNNNNNNNSNNNHHHHQYQYHNHHTTATTKISNNYPGTVTGTPPTGHKQSSSPSNHHFNTATSSSSYYCTAKEDNVDASHIVFRSVARRKTDLMPTIPSPRDGHHYSSRSSLSNTPRTPGRAYSMTRLDQLATPIRRNGEHIRAILEREKREQMEMLEETASVGGGAGRRRRILSSSSSTVLNTAGGRGPLYQRRSQGVVNGSMTPGSGSGASTNSATQYIAMSRSMSHLAGGGTGGRHQYQQHPFNQHSNQQHHQQHQQQQKQQQHQMHKYSLGGGISSSFRPLGRGQRDACKSMTHLLYTGGTWCTQQNQQQLPRSNLGLQTTATTKYLQSSFNSSSINNNYTKTKNTTSGTSTTKRGQQHYTTNLPIYHHLDNFDPNSLLLMNSSFSVTAGVCKSVYNNKTNSIHINSYNHPTTPHNHYHYHLYFFFFTNTQ